MQANMQVSRPAEVSRAAGASLPYTMCITHMCPHKAGLARAKRSGAELESQPHEGFGRTGSNTARLGQLGLRRCDPHISLLRTFLSSKELD